MIFASGFTWFTLLEGLRDDHLLGFVGVTGTSTIFVHACLASFLIVGMALLARLALNKSLAAEGMERHFGEHKLTPRTFFEVYVQGAMSLMTDLMPKRDAVLFFPLIGAIFLYIFVNNLLALVPGLSPATDNINTNVGMAIIVFLTFMYVAVTRDAVGFFKHMWGPLFITGFLIFPVEVLGLLLRPVSLSLRLTGNLFGDHTAFGVVSHLMPPVAPAAMLGLALFVSFMQAFVFALLTAVYISMSLPHAEDEHH